MVAWSANRPPACLTNCAPANPAPHHPTHPPSRLQLTVLERWHTRTAGERWALLKLSGKQAALPRGPCQWAAAADATPSGGSLCRLTPWRTNSIYPGPAFCALKLIVPSPASPYSCLQWPISPTLLWCPCWLHTLRAAAAAGTRGAVSWSRPSSCRQPQRCCRPWVSRLPGRLAGQHAPLGPWPAWAADSASAMHAPTPITACFRPHPTSASSIICLQLCCLMWRTSSTARWSPAPPRRRWVGGRVGRLDRHCQGEMRGPREACLNVYLIGLGCRSCTGLCPATRSRNQRSQLLPRALLPAAATGYAEPPAAATRVPAC